MSIIVVLGTIAGLATGATVGLCFWVAALVRENRRIQKVKESLEENCNHFRTKVDMLQSSNEDLRLVDEVTSELKHSSQDLRQQISSLQFTMIEMQKHSSLQMPGVKTDKGVAYIADMDAWWKWLTNEIPGIKGMEIVLQHRNGESRHRWG